MTVTIFIVNSNIYNMILRVKHLILILLGTLIVFSGGSLFAADFDDWRLELRPTYSWYNSNKESLHGIGTGIMGSWRAYDTLYLKLDTEILFLDITNPGDKYLWEISAGLNYDVDITPIILTIGTGIGPLFTKNLEKTWETDASWHLLLSMQYRIIREFGIGIEGRYHFILTQFDTRPLFFTASFKLFMSF